MPKDELNVWEFAVFVRATATALAGAELLNLSHRLEDAVVGTTIVFAAVLLALRPAWRRRQMWLNIIPIFLLHVLLFAVLYSSMTSLKHLPGVVMIVGGMAEVLAIIVIVSRRITTRDRDGAPHRAMENEND